MGAHTHHRCGYVSGNSLFFLLLPPPLISAGNILHSVRLNKKYLLAQISFSVWPHIELLFQNTCCQKQIISMLIYSQSHYSVSVFSRIKGTFLKIIVEMSSLHINTQLPLMRNTQSGRLSKLSSRRLNKI